jgi:hypothetical protein
MDLLNIKSYKKDGFVKVADVKHDPIGQGTWWYQNINEELMFEDHRSWVYAVVSGEEVVKIGETGNPLGILSTRMPYKGQPIAGSTNRFGRLRSQGNVSNPKDIDTDVRIRRSLYEDVSKGVGYVSLWAKRCDISHVQSKLYGKPFIVPVSYHKEIEKGYLRRILEETGRLPRLNVGRI